MNERGALICFGTYFSNRRAIIIAQRAFTKQFKIALVGYVPDRKLNIQWMDTFMDTDSV